MANKRIKDKRRKKQIGPVLECIAENLEKQDDVLEHLERQEKIMQFLYREHLDDQKEELKEYLKHCISKREDLLKDIAYFRAENNTEAVKRLSIYVEEYTQYLELKDVEILTCRVGDVFDPMIEHHVRSERVQPKYHNRVTYVHGTGCGYRWKGEMLKRIFVSVGVGSQ